MNDKYHVFLYNNFSFAYIDEAEYDKFLFERDDLTALILYRDNTYNIRHDINSEDLIELAPIDMDSQKGKMINRLFNRSQLTLQN